MPFILNILNPFASSSNQISSIARHALTDLLDEVETSLVSPFGLRSLSKQDPLYHTVDDYWRGDVWISINYLFLRSLATNYLIIVSQDPQHWVYMRERLQKYDSYIFLACIFVDYTINCRRIWLKLFIIILIHLK